MVEVEVTGYNHRTVGRDVYVADLDHDGVSSGWGIIVDVNDGGGGLARLEYIQDLDVRVFYEVCAEGD